MTLGGTGTLKPQHIPDKMDVKTISRMSSEMHKNKPRSGVTFKSQSRTGMGLNGRVMAGKHMARGSVPNTKKKKKKLINVICPNY
jgi:hypothetical protein